MFKRGYPSINCKSLRLRNGVLVHGSCHGGLCWRFYRWCRRHPYPQPNTSGQYWKPLEPKHFLNQLQVWVTDLVRRIVSIYKHVHMCQCTNVWSISWYWIKQEPLNKEIRTIWLHMRPLTPHRLHTDLNKLKATYTKSRWQTQTGMD